MKGIEKLKIKPIPTISKRVYSHKKTPTRVVRVGVISPRERTVYRRTPSPAIVSAMLAANSAQSQVP